MHEPGSRHFVESARTLAEAALSPDPRVAATATRALFADLVEPWADSFEPALCAKYAALMCEVVCAPGSPVAASLAALGYLAPEDLHERHDRISSARVGPGGDRQLVRKVAVLSRVTLGADMAVTRPVLLAAARAFPAAEIEFIGPHKNAELILPGQSFCHRAISYGRSALLADRLLVWHELRASVRSSVAGLRDEQYLIVDPDSRLTQLGVLPVAPDTSYRFFGSRSFGGAAECGLGVLADRWCSRAWGVEPCRVPQALPVPEQARQCLADAACRPLAAVSLGVGGREAKRLGDGFESGLLELLRQRGYRIVLDYGSGDDEACVVNRHIASFAGRVGRLSRDLRGWPSCADLLTWQGSLADFGMWVGAADLYVGYDSAAVHVAAAYGTPLIEIFAGASHDRFRQRWTPVGVAPVHVLPASGSADASAVLERVGRLLTGSSPSFVRTRFHM